MAASETFSAIVNFAAAANGLFDEQATAAVASPETHDDVLMGVEQLGTDLQNMVASVHRKLSGAATLQSTHQPR